MSSGSIDPQVIQEITRRVITRLSDNPAPAAAAANPSSRSLPVGVSVRHIHLCPEHIEILFGPGSELKPRNELYQKGEYASTFAVTLVGPRMRCMDQVRILGPSRTATQVELARTDAIHLGLDPPVKPSGHLEGTPGVIMVGPVGVVHLKQGVIRANRHMHINESDAATWGLQDNGTCAVRLAGEKVTVFEDVQVRVDNAFRAELHLDTDDANAAGITTGDLAEIL